MKKLLLLGLLLASNSLVFAQWTPLGLNHEVLSSYKYGNTTFAGTPTGIYYKTDSETTWNQATGITSKAKDFTENNGILYVASYERVYKSTDNGLTWEAMPLISEFEDVNTVVVSSITGAFLAGMDNHGIFSSIDGSDWQQVGTSNQSSNTAIVKKGDTLFSSCWFGGSLQLSQNNGVDWDDTLGQGITIQPSSFPDIKSLTILNDETLVAGVIDSFQEVDYSGVYFSNDNGDHFLKKINGMSNIAVEALASVGNLLFAGTNGGGVYYSADAGTNWMIMNTGLTDLAVTKLKLSGTTLFASTATDLFTTDICNLLQGTSVLMSDQGIPLGKNGLADDETGMGLTATTGGTTYEWYKDGVLIDGATTNRYIATEDGNYNVKIFYSATCSDLTNSIYLSGLGIHDIIGSTFKYYPNPVTNLLTIENSDTLVKNIKISDTNGRILNTSEITTENAQVDFSSYAPGVYFVTINSGEKVLKIVKN